ncbi:Telomere-associated protein Rif1, N-terminal [Lasallia pustulata]|uniref:Telomere-associated protein Rif1, N-terminal n=1 Tax=Lasallia pustulata TaxID=136370 RepID=A0A1W5CSF8_9LECA|nr:Telomere-associated protein Rif1, N-terminal [Lasallia pustulata]
MVDVVRGLATLPTRPPTPPKDSIFNKASKPLNGASLVAGIAHTAALDTPHESPSSSADYFASNCDKTSKRVGFSPWNKYHQPPSSSRRTASPEGSIKPLPPSRELKSLKSILKPYDRLIPTDPSGTIHHAQADNFPAMLDSVTQQLAGTSRSSRLDAYMTLIGCLKAYDNVPDPQAMADKMDLLAQFIRRDVCAQVPKTGSMDSTLATQALKLITIFLWTPSLADSLPDDFRAFIVEKSILALEDNNMPKMIVNHYMHLLSTQKFRPKTLTNERVNRLLTALDQVTNHVKGNGVVGQRLMIYQRLLTQTRSVMINRIGDWIDHLFSGMLSSMKEVRARAIALGIEAGLALGTTPTASRAVMDVFNRELVDGKKFAELISQRLNSMVNSKEDGTHVPQVWSVVVLFLRGRRHQLEHWEYMKTWLFIIQRCFNSSDTQVKFQAHVAWNRLIFAICPDTSTSPGMVTTLRQPFISQLERKPSDRHAKQTKQITYASYCTLLYYALRPSATHAQLDSFWDTYVSRILSNCFLSNEADTDYACRVLIALFGNVQASVWHENRANENGLIKPDELPRLDPKWTRLRAATVLKVFETILGSASWQKEDDGEARVMHAWRSFVRAIADAGNKEVKVSMESMSAIAHILRVIKCFWAQRHMQSEHDTTPDGSVYLQRIRLLVNAAIDCLGPIPFTEKRLLQSSQDSFEAAETPSSPSIQHNGVLRSPVVCLVDFLRSSAEAGPQAVDAYRKISTDLLQASLAIASTRPSQLKALREWIHLISLDDSASLQSNIVIWQSIAECASASLTSASVPESASDNAPLVGHEYRDVVKVLESGAKLQSEEIAFTWESLHQKLHHQVKDEIGSGATVLAVTEPLAGVLRLGKLEHDNSGLLLLCTASVVEHALWPENRQVIEHARKHLWGPGSTSHKSAPFDPFDHLYTSINHFLNETYTNFTSISPTHTTRLVAAVASLISSCPLSLRAILLKRIQKGLAMWIEDASGLLSPFGIGNQQDLYLTVQQLCAVIVTAIDSLPRKDSKLLQVLETLIVSCLRSRHKSIVNESLALWNRTFGTAKHLEYSNDLRAALLRLRSITEVFVPGRSEEDEVEVQSTPFNFIESQENGPEAVLPVKGSHGAERRSDTDVQRDVTPQKLTEAVRKILSHGTRNIPKPAERKAEAKSTPTRRLRHDDSQIQFAAIDSSPLGSDALDSQLLTDRQKEVTERQRLEAAAMFPGLGSSPPVRTRGHEDALPKLFLSVDRRSYERVDVDDTESPTLPPVDALMNDFIPSSPSSRSNQKRSDATVKDTASRSSPPAATVQADALSVDGPPSSPPRIHQGHDEPPAMDELASRVIPGFQHHNRDMPVVDHGMQSPALVSPPMAKLDISSCDLQVAASLQVEPYSPAGDHHASDLDIFVDAHSSPVSSSPPTSAGFREDSLESSQKLELPNTQDETTNTAAHDAATSEEGNPRTVGDVLLQDKGRTVSTYQEEVSRIDDSFRAASLHSSPGYEKQTSAQLVNDLERASSQVELHSVAAIEVEIQSSQPKQKRKRAPESPAHSPKKAKVRSLRKTVQVVIERRQTAPAAEELHDCIVVDASAVKACRHPLSQEIKPKPSPSSKAAAKTLTPNKRLPAKPARRGRPPMKGSVESQEDQPKTFKKRKAGSGGDMDDQTAQRESKRRRSTRLGGASAIGEEVYSPIDSQKLVGLAFASLNRSTDPLVLAGSDVDDDDNGYGVMLAEEADTKSPGQMPNAVSESSAPTSESVVKDASDADGGDKTTIADSGGDARSYVRPVEENSEQHQDGEMGEGSQSLAGEESEMQATTKAAAYDVPPEAAAEAAEAKGVAHTTPIPKGQGILTGLKRMLRDIQHITLGHGEEREIVKALFELGKGVSEAGHRRS